MTKTADDTVLDGLLDIVANNGNKMTVCSTQPTTYAQANATYELASASMSTGAGNGDYTEANGDVSGRKLTMTQKSNLTIDNSGTALFIAIIDTTHSVLLVVTSCTSQALTSGNTVTIPAWKMEVADPT